VDKTGNRSRLIALAAILILLLQSFGSAWAEGARPAASLVDAFGNVLCATASDHDGSVPAGDHGKMANCCTFGCGNASPFLGTPPVQLGWLIEPREFAADLLGMAEIVRAEHSDFDPARPRAPPVIR
jgi:hypothetical protein